MGELDRIAWAFGCHEPSMTLPLSMSRPPKFKLTHYRWFGARILDTRMHQISRIGAAFALLLSLVGPSMMCALPASHLTASERECCRNMQGECGRMKMPASHSCCQHDMGPTQVDATQPERGSFHLVISLAALLPQSPFAQPPTVAGRRITPPNDSPPISSALSISVLRI